MTRQQDLCLKIYPLINKIENLLRRYIVKFFITKIGLGWFEISAPTEVKVKLKARKDNEPVFTKTSLVDTDVTLIDFNELGEIITRQTSVYSKVEDVIDKINNATTLDELKNEVTGHYPKYFKTIFEKQNFESKWKTLFDIRNKVAHNNYIFQKDLDDATKLTGELEIMLAEAEDKIDEAVLTITEKQAISKAIQEVVTEQQNIIPEKKEEIIAADNEVKVDHTPFKINFTNLFKILDIKLLTEEVFLDEFTNFKTQKRNWTFIALSQFLDYLEEKGYNRQIASSTASILTDKGKIVIEYIDNPYNNFHKTATIKMP